MLLSKTAYENQESRFVKRKNGQLKNKAHKGQTALIFKFFLKQEGQSKRSCNNEQEINSKNEDLSFFPITMPSQPLHMKAFIKQTDKSHDPFSATDEMLFGGQKDWHYQKQKLMRKEIWQSLISGKVSPTIRNANTIEVHITITSEN